MKDKLAWIFGALLSLAAGWVHLAVDDPTVPALLVVMISMGLALARPERWWRWAVLTSIAVPAAQVFNYLRGVPFQRGEAQGAFVIGLVSGIVGAVAGHFGHRIFASLLRGLRERPDYPGQQGTGDREEEPENADRR